MRHSTETNNNNTMQNYIKTIGALAAASALAAGSASAQVEYALHTGYSNDYIFRGIDLGDNLFETGLDASFEINGFAVSAGAWYATFDNAGVDSQELDLYAKVSQTISFATMSLGYISYNNMNANPGILDDAQEAFVSAGFDFYGYAGTLTYYFDIETDNDGYADLGLAKSYELSPCLTLNTGATLGYQVEQGQLGHLTSKVSLDWGFAESATLSPYIAHSWALSDDVNTYYRGSKNELFGGVMLAVSF